MASQWPPKKNTAFTLFFSLYKSDGTIIANPGTYTKKVSIDGAAVADITASVTEEDTTYGQLSVVLSSSEMNGDAIWVYIKDDTAGCVPFTCTIYTAANLLDDVKTDTAAILADTGTDGVVVASASKTGYTLTATTGLGNQTANITGTLSGSVGSVTGNVGGNVTGSVGSVATGGITAASIADGAIDAATFAADVWTRLGIVTYGTAQSVTGTTIQLASASTFADDELIGSVVVITGSSTGVGQSRMITDYVSSTDTATVDTWTTTPTGTITYVVFAAAPASATSLPAVNVTQISGDSVAADNLKAAADGTGYNLGGGSVVAASVTGAVGSVTGNVGGNVTGSVGSVTGAVGSVTGAVGSVTGNVGGNVTGSVGSLATQAKADVNAEVLDVLVTDTFAEPTGVPAATSSLKDKLVWLFTLGRNKVTQTATTQTLRNDADSATVATSTVSDDSTTFTRGEWS